VTTPTLTGVLQEFHRDKHALRERHIAGATRVSSYDYNNTYQYIINREDAQISWLRGALEELGVAEPEGGPAPTLPEARKGAEAERAVIEDDIRQVEAFLGKWRGRVRDLSHARHRRMLEVILGETVEHHRFFQQMLAGRDDVLGRRTGGERTGGGVLPVRWLRQ
jgi:hypothetical protein